MSLKHLNEWDDALQAVIDDMHGKPLNVHRFLANNPALLAAWWSFRNYVVKGGALSQPDCEMLILRLAHRTACWYEWASHVDRGLQAGLNDQNIDMARAEIHTLPDGSATKALLGSVDELLSNQGLSEETQTLLEAHYTTSQVLDIIAIHSVYVMLGNVIHTWGLSLDEDVAERLPQDQTESAFAANRAGVS